MKFQVAMLLSSVQQWFQGPLMTPSKARNPTEVNVNERWPPAQATPLLKIDYCIQGQADKKRFPDTQIPKAVEIVQLQENKKIKLIPKDD